MPSGEKNKRHFTYTKMSEDLAYLLGVFMGDGSVWIRTENGREYGLFQIHVADIDFLDTVIDKVENVFGYRPEKRLSRKARGNAREMQQVRVCSSQFAVWLRDITESKTIVPPDILVGTPEVKKAFLQGLMDSEGYVMERRHRTATKGSPYVGFAVKGEWAHDVQRLMTEFAYVPEAKLRFGDMWKIRIHPLEYQKMGLSFSIQRKKEIFEEILQDPRLRDIRAPKPERRKKWSHKRLTPQEREEIRAKYNNGEGTYAEIGREYGVCEETVCRLMNNHTYQA